MRRVPHVSSGSAEREKHQCHQIYSVRPFDKTQAGSSPVEGLRNVFQEPTSAYGRFLLSPKAWFTTFCMASTSIHSAFHVTTFFAPSLRRSIGRTPVLGISTRKE